MNNVKIIFFGTSHFAVPILNRLADSPFKSSLIVTQPDAIAGRKKTMMPPPIKVAAEALSIEIIQPSLLPFFRGQSPIHTAILSGVLETAVTIIQMDEEIDHGPIVAQEKINLSGSETYNELQKILSEYSANLLLKTLPEYCFERIKPKTQDHSIATFTKLIKSEDAALNWAKSAIEIDRQIHAYHLWPKAHTFWKPSSDTRSLRINILKAGKAESPQICKPGTVVPSGRAFAIAAEKDLIVPEIVQLEGRREIDAVSFLNGHKDIIGAILI